jgi:hypothetical protein
MIRNLIKSARTRALVSALCGFLGYGSWGVWINMSHGWQAGLKAGLTQGSYSFMVTLFYSGLIEWIYAKTQKKALTIIVCCLSVVMTSYLIHSLAGTPEIIPTIAPGVVIGSIYVSGYVKLLSYTAGVSKGQGQTDIRPRT